MVEKYCDGWKILWWLKKIVIMKKYCDDWKILWWLKNIVIMKKYCDDWNVSNMNKFIKTVLNFLFIFYKNIFTHIKSIKTLNKRLLLRCFLLA